MSDSLQDFASFFADKFDPDKAAVFAAVMNDLMSGAPFNSTLVACLLQDILGRAIDGDDEAERMMRIILVRLSLFISDQRADARLRGIIGADRTKIIRRRRATSWQEWLNSILTTAYEQLEGERPQGFGDVRLWKRANKIAGDDPRRDKITERRVKAFLNKRRSGSAETGTLA
ncbi:hypothetical protein [uncultured Thiodictyon sp.]|uniref:hypothetical protein n=1 Tax=uncultured Thiodictyon sp. TaxID=1846217 RepID=UPI0025DE80CF|nr:hypothetical protein [uncultured Thiodictyon sp.]